MYLTWGVAQQTGKAATYYIHDDYGSANVNFFTGATSATLPPTLTAGYLLLIIVAIILAIWTFIRMLKKCIKKIRRDMAKRQANYVSSPVTFAVPISTGQSQVNPSYDQNSSRSGGPPTPQSQSQSQSSFSQNSQSSLMRGGPDMHVTRAIPRQPGDPVPNPKYRPGPPQMPGGVRPGKPMPPRPGFGPLAPGQLSGGPPQPVQNNTFTGAYYRGSEIVYPKQIQDRSMRRTLKEMKKMEQTKIEVVKDDTQRRVDATIISEKGTGNPISLFFDSVFDARVPRTQLTVGYLLVVVIYLGINVGCFFIDAVDTYYYPIGS